MGKSLPKMRFGRDGGTSPAIRSCRLSASDHSRAAASRRRSRRGRTGVEPGVEDHELANGLPPLKAYEAERGDEERAASITGCGGLRPSRGYDPRQSPGLGYKR